MIGKLNLKKMLVRMVREKRKERAGNDGFKKAVETKRKLKQWPKIWQLTSGDF
jgi:hypothetical protein